ncbi:DUF2062 domain-containing protein [Beggiatoa leptomitoformis]|uniref:DUF2062 domain-containing protein n=1 Tax=Beggiatoa leptomitoformis TaxID=288004 RepID=A0A2N9YD75_9GAMM|nr:DUF2062 domain-containing protein [Beggiatoa leptomitoformis]AUI68453.1 DUF2062 domain-containing protein [Beggiatoa leptomitoformis]QGX03848.1 DUF2062 domain-containing protein [Beggiatoa leptomitoformis]
MNWIKKTSMVFFDLLKQGLSPTQLALCIAWGVLLGVMPMLGVSTLLCVFIAYFFGLNQVAIQLANYLAYPLQLTGFYVFNLLGAQVVFTNNHLTLDLLYHLLESNLHLLLENFGVFIIQAFIGWVISAPFVFLSIYLLCLGLFTRLITRKPLNPPTKHPEC